ncbi:hypothetical protein G6L37_03960 [Agrobacterium rubi]|nr:hypothetical protein [Agrobacterium rubi]NTF24505.1 hypothetical protein [Agrobacterium rubi]
MDTATILEALAKQLSQGLAEGFSVVAVPELGFVAIFSAQYGVATLVPTADAAEAMAAAERLAAVARGAGLDIAPVPFGITKGAGIPPVIVREHFLAVDILRTMLAAPRPETSGADAVTKLKAAIQSIPRPMAPRGVSANVLLVAETVVRKVLKDERAWLYGIDIGAKDIVSPSYLLPAVLTVAAMRWAPPVVAAGKQGGFTVSLAPSSTAVLGYSVSGVDIANPVLFFLPIVDVVRRSFKGGECWVDGIVEQYADYMKKQGHASDVQDLEVRVVVGGS